MDNEGEGDGLFDFSDIEEEEVSRMTGSDIDRCNRERQRAPIHWTPPAVAPEDNHENAGSPRGIFYSLEFPVSEQGLQSLGAEWLTDAMRAAGTLAAGNSISSLESVQRLGNSLNGAIRLLLSVAYLQEHVLLHEKLLMKLNAVDSGEHMMERQSSSASSSSKGEEERSNGAPRKYCRVPFPDAPLEPFDYFTEINFYRLYEDRSPYIMPKFYYGDICRSTGNSLLITEYVPLPGDQEYLRGSKNANQFFIQDQMGGFLTAALTSGGLVHISQNQDSTWTLQNQKDDDQVLLSMQGLYLIANSETSEISLKDLAKINGAETARWSLVPDTASNERFRIKTLKNEFLLASPDNAVFLSSNPKVSRRLASESRELWYILPVEPQTSAADSKFGCFDLKDMQLEDCRNMLCCGAKLAALHKTGELGPPELVEEAFTKPVEQPQDWGFGTLTDQAFLKKAARVQDFMLKVGAAIFPKGILNRKLMKEYRSMITTIKGNLEIVSWYLNFEVDYVALGRGRMDANSAINLVFQPYWTVGFRDCEGISVGSLGAKIWHWLRYASIDVLDTQVDSLLQEFIVKYHKFGGPLLNFPVLRLHLATGAAIDSLLLLDSIDEIYRACPQDQWRSVTDLNSMHILEAKTPCGSLWQCLKAFVNTSLLLKNFRVSEMTNVSFASIKTWYVMCAGQSDVLMTAQDNVDVRNSPSASSTLIAYLPVGAIVIVPYESMHPLRDSDRSTHQLGNSDGYVAVHGPVKGWMLAQHLCYVEETQEPFDSPDEVHRHAVASIIAVMQSVQKQFIGGAEGMSVIGACKLYDDLVQIEYFTGNLKVLNAGQPTLVHGSFLAQVERCDWWPEEYEHWVHHSFIRFENGSIADIGAREFDDVPLCWFPADRYRYELDSRKADESNWIRHHVVGIEKWTKLTRASNDGRKRSEWWLTDSSQSVLNPMSKTSHNDKQVALTNTSDNEKDFIALRNGTPLPLPPISRQVELKGSSGVSIRRLTTADELEVCLIENLFEDTAVDTLLTCCNERDGFQPSVVSTSDSKGVVGSKRTSWSCAMHWHSASSKEYAENWQAHHGATEDQQQKELQLVREVASRCAEVLQVSTSHIEPLQLVKYTPGQFFKPHLDSHREPERSSSFNGEQRTHTLLVFLNNVPASDGGGCLHFPMLGLKIRPRKGCAVIWKNVCADGSPDPDSLHEGEAPIKCEKFAMNVWITDRPLTEEGLSSKRKPKIRPACYEVVHSHLVARAAADVTSHARAVLKKGTKVYGTVHEVDGSPWLLLSRKFCSSKLQLRSDVFGDVWVLIHGKHVGLGELLKPVEQIEPDAKKATKAVRATKTSTPKPAAVNEGTVKEARAAEVTKAAEQIFMAAAVVEATTEEATQSKKPTKKEAAEFLVQYYNHLHRTRRFERHDWRGEVSWEQLERWSRDEPTVYAGGVENLLGKS